MAKTKHNSSHKTRVNNFKNQNKQKLKNMAENTPGYEIPEVRNVPVWANDSKIVITGFEFECLFNSLMQVQTAQQAVNGIMSRNILEGNIQMDFEKYDPARKDYGPMTDEEKVPYKADFAKAVEAAKRPQTENKIITPPTDFVDSDGNTISSKNLGTQPDSQVKETAKVVKGDFGAKKTVKPTKAKKSTEVGTNPQPNA